MATATLRQHFGPKRGWDDEFRCTPFHREAGCHYAPFPHCLMRLLGNESRTTISAIQPRTSAFDSPKSPAANIGEE